MKKILYNKRYLVLIMSVVFTYIITAECICPNFNSINTATYKYGSKGQVVREIQTRLKKWGYYKNNVDGVYGYNTYLSIKSFQKKNGLRVDGIAGDKTLAALGINTGKASKTANTNKSTTSNQDVLLLARLINGEARGEPYEGQVAVGAVVLNRVKNSKFPSTIAGVIYQPGAFTAIVDGQIHSEMKETSIKAAKDAMNGWDPSGGAIYYFNPAKTTNKWIWSRPLIKIIGKHRFCR